MIKQEEPYEGRLSRTVPWEPKGETPLGDSTTANAPSSVDNDGVNDKDWYPQTRKKLTGDILLTKFLHADKSVFQNKTRDKEKTNGRHPSNNLNGGRQSEQLRMPTALAT